MMPCAHSACKAKQDGMNPWGLQYARLLIYIYWLYWYTILCIYIYTDYIDILFYVYIYKYIIVLYYILFNIIYYIYSIYHILYPYYLYTFNMCFDPSLEEFLQASVGRRDGWTPPREGNASIPGCGRAARVIPKYTPCWSMLYVEQK